MYDHAFLMKQYFSPPQLPPVSISAEPFSGCLKIFVRFFIIVSSVCCHQRMVHRLIFSRWRSQSRSSCCPHTHRQWDPPQVIIFKTMTQCIATGQMQNDHDWIYFPIENVHFPKQHACIGQRVGSVPGPLGLMHDKPCIIHP